MLTLGYYANFAGKVCEDGTDANGAFPKHCWGREAFLYVDFESEFLSTGPGDANKSLTFPPPASDVPLKIVKFVDLAICAEFE